MNPKDGELCLRRTKTEETVTEARNDTDGQIVRHTWVSRECLETSRSIFDDVVLARACGNQRNGEMAFSRSTINDNLISNGSSEGRLSYSVFCMQHPILRFIAVLFLDHCRRLVVRKFFFF